MTSDADIQQQIYQYFLIEAPELLQAIEQDLYTLLEKHEVETVHNLMRNAHTLKGSSASVGRDTLKTVAHHLEDVFKSLYDPQIVFDSELSALLLEGYECLKAPLMAEIAGIPYDENAILDRTATVFAQLQHKLGDFFGQDAPVLNSTDLGYDVVAAIFQDSIPEELHQLEVCLSQGNPQIIQETLQQQAEFFLGLAQSYNLPTWESCAQQVLDALATQPDAETIAMIGEVALESYRQTAAQILAGDRGTPTPEPAALPPTPEESVEITLGTTSPPVPIPTIASPPPREETPSTEAPAKPEAATPALTVRVPVQQLDYLNHDLGELLINYNQQSLTTEQTSIASRESLSTLLLCKQQLFRLKDWADQNLLNAAALSPRDPQFDSLEMDQYGELHIMLQSTMESISTLEKRLESMDGLVQVGHHNLKQQKRLLHTAQDNLIEARTIPLDTLLERFPRMVQQLATSHHKPVELVLTGSSPLVDKGIVEQLYEPLLHLIRNAFDHGIESPEVRQQQGKSPTGKVTLHTHHYGNQITIAIQDDGQGLNWEKIYQKAIAQGLLTTADRVTEAELAEFLFLPGFSTASQLSELSGRGVGLDVVRSRLHTIESSIVVDSTPGKGTTFTLQIPLALTTVRLLVCQAQGIAYAFLMDGIEQILLPLGTDIQLQGERRLLLRTAETGKHLIPIRALDEFMHYQRPYASTATTTTSMQAGFFALGSSTSKPLLLLKGLNHPQCLEVDQILAEQELVLKAFPAQRSGPHLPPYILGYTVLGDGKLTLVIDTTRLVQGSSLSPTPLGTGRVSRSLPAAPEVGEVSPGVESPPQPRKTTIVLIIDDSITQRQSMVLTLQRSGFTVLQASNGQEALAQLGQEPGIEAIICDIEMPRMNGFEFLQAYRSDLNLVQVPVIMLTSRTGEKHRQTALELGANDYMTKPYNERELLQVIHRFLHTPT